MRLRHFLLPALLVLLACAIPASAQAASGTVYLADSQGGGDNTCFGTDPCGAIFKIPPGGGQGSVLAAGSGTSPLQGPSGLVRYGDGDLLAASSFDDRIVRVDGKTGAVHTFLHSPKIPYVNQLARTRDKLYLTDAGTDLYSVNLKTKAVHKVNSKPFGSGTGGVAIDGDRAFVGDENVDFLYEVNLRTGGVRKFSSDPRIQDTQALAISPDHKFLYGASLGRLTRIRISSGAIRRGSDHNFVSVAVRPAGGFLGGDIMNNEVDRVRQDLSTATPFCQNPLFNYPSAIVIEP